jgi:hypothetical protein
MNALGTWISIPVKQLEFMTILVVTSSLGL